MKNIKKILLLSLISFFTLTTFGIAKECNYKSKVQQALCEKVGELKSGSSTSTKKEKKKKAKKVKKEKKELPGTLVDLLEKLKTKN